MARPCEENLPDAKIVCREWNQPLRCALPDDPSFTTQQKHYRYVRGRLPTGLETDSDALNYDWAVFARSSRWPRGTASALTEAYPLVNIRAGPPISQLYPIPINPGIRMCIGGVRINPFDDILPPSVDDIIFMFICGAVIGRVLPRVEFAQKYGNDKRLALSCAAYFRRFTLVSKKFHKAMQSTMELLRATCTVYLDPTMDNLREHITWRWLPNFYRFKKLVKNDFIPEMQPLPKIMEGKMVKVGYVTRWSSADRKASLLIKPTLVEMHNRNVRSVIERTRDGKQLSHRKYVRGVLRVCLTFEPNSQDTVYSLYSKKGRLTAQVSDHQHYWRSGDLVTCGKIYEVPITYIFRGVKLLEVYNSYCHYYTQNCVYTLYNGCGYEPCTIEERTGEWIKKRNFPNGASFYIPELRVTLVNQSGIRLIGFFAW